MHAPRTTDRVAARYVIALSLAGLLLSAGPAPAQDAKEKAAAASLANYKRLKIRGFNVLVHNDVLENNKDPRWRRKPLEVLDLELGTIDRVLPTRTVNALRRILVWVEWEDKDDPDHRRAVAKYYGVIGTRALWTFSARKHPGKANNVEIINMRSLTREHQPGVKFERCVLLHELSHAVHHQLFGAHNPAIRAAYRQAMERKLYERTTDVYGRRRRPYAAVNEREYFAELSCAYLDKLHYHPFNHEELRKHDPVGYRLMELVWGTRQRLEAAQKIKRESEASGKILAARRLHTSGRTGPAREALRRIVDGYPGTRAAAEAGSLLEKWKE
jgi:hypothetical protein